MLWFTCVLVIASCFSMPTVAAQPQKSKQSDDLFLFRPDTPERQVRGAVLAEKLERPELALGYLQDLLDSAPTTAQLLDLRRAFGIGVFLKLSATKSLQPASQELLQKINEASRQNVAAVADLEQLVQQLGESNQQTVDASLKILAADFEAVRPLLNADPATPSGRVADQLLKKYALRFRAGLVQALPDADAKTQTRILNLLADTDVPDLVDDVLSYQFSESPDVAAAATHAARQLSRGRPVPTTSAEAVGALLKSATNLIARAGRTFPGTADVQDDRRLSNAPADQPGVYGAASLAKAVSLANSAAQIDPENSRVIAMQLVAELTEQAWPATWPEQVVMPDSDADISKADDVSTLALQIALDTENPAAILSLLRRTDSSSAVLKNDATLLRSCLLHFDPRVRLLAAGIATSIGETSRFSRLTLAAAAAGAEKPEAVVMDSRTSDGLTVAAVVNELNYAAQASRTGQGGFEVATGQLHCELVLVHSNVLRWSLSDTIANLRADYRTQSVPIVVYGPKSDRDRTEIYRTQNTGVWFESEPVSDLTLGQSMKLMGVPGPLLTKEERQRMIGFARERNSRDGR
ncbi:MAG: hypothetical protein R3C59_07690 [Planctomycetaceae bacterium]